MLMYVRRLKNYQNCLLSPFFEIFGIFEDFHFFHFWIFFQTAILRTCAERIHEPKCFSAKMCTILAQNFNSNIWNQRKDRRLKSVLKIRKKDTTATIKKGMYGECESRKTCQIKCNAYTVKILNGDATRAKASPAIICDIVVDVLVEHDCLWNLWLFFLEHISVNLWKFQKIHENFRKFKFCFWVKFWLRFLIAACMHAGLTCIQHKNVCWY